jgi:hypothetical protein
MVAEMHAWRDRPISRCGGWSILFGVGRYSASILIFVILI